ncbi:FecCD family ABC transporter permease [Marinicellulosiphila megalodicopiae]|uniref:FecCD family ABC transporter permease n=1 Tax=Marinicellulosiphila megalodicopiae TaxID=2724896 RepID=UPI003BAE3BBF
MNIKMVSTGLIVILLSVCILSLMIGAYPIEFKSILQIVFRFNVQSIYPTDEAVLLQVRLPRLIMAMLIGGSLAICGAVIQGLFRNPLADPGLIGISTGAMLFAIFTIVFGGVWLSASVQAYALPISGFVGACLVTFMVYRLSTTNNHTDITIMLLAGIAITALGGALTGIIIYMADDNQLRDITFWSMGSLANLDWHDVMITAPVLLVCAFVLTRFAGPLNLMLMGESVSKHSGVDVIKLKKRIIMIVALMVSICVCLSGLIGFVGLVCPHIVRLAVGPDHKKVIPLSAVLGACMLCVADLCSRVIIAPAELPIGIITALIGAPFFMWLLVKQKQTS